MAVPLAIMAVGAGIQAYGQWKSSQSAAEAARQNARIRRAQANEILEKMQIQSERINAQGEDFKAKQINDFASGGVQLGAGATLVALEDTNMKINQQVEDMKRDSMFKANQVLMGAKVDEQMAKDTESAGQIGAFGTLLGGAGSAYKNS